MPLTPGCAAPSPHQTPLATVPRRPAPRIAVFCTMCNRAGHEQVNLEGGQHVRHTHARTGYMNSSAPKLRCRLAPPATVTMAQVSPFIPLQQRSGWVKEEACRRTNTKRAKPASERDRARQRQGAIAACYMLPIIVVTHLTSCPPRYSPL